MNYRLQSDASASKKVQKQTFKELMGLISHQKKALFWTLIALLINTAMGLCAPILVAYIIDHAIAQGDFTALVRQALLLLGIYGVAFVANYQQVVRMGEVGQTVLFDLRNQVFRQLQALPLAFFQANKAGDLISRINNDTGHLSTLFSETLVRLVGSFVIMGGAAVLMVALHWQLGLLALAPALLLWGVTVCLSPWIRQKNAQSLKQTGILSSHIQESLDNFKVIVAFERRDYFRQRFFQTNRENYQAAQGAGVANQVFSPLYGLMSQWAQLAVLMYGLYLLTQRQLSVGLLVAYFTYVSRFYDPLRQVAMLWSSFQLSLASWERIRELLAFENPMHIIPSPIDPALPVSAPVIAFEDVAFSYDKDLAPVLSAVNFSLEAGKTYAFVGPTGGGKSTTAGLMSRLYDPTAGSVRLQGRDLRSLSAQERADKIGFILQEPFLFEGSVAENLRYGQASGFVLEDKVAQLQLEEVMRALERLPEGLQTQTEHLSLGQKQLVSFIRAVLKDPDLLILDEATANIDTATEALLEKALVHLPRHTTRVIIAHRLNTIENADVIFFVNEGRIQQAGDFSEALQLLLSQERQT